MLLISRVCAEFHDRTGAVLFTIRPADRFGFINAPESIRQDPLFDMLVHDGSIEIPKDKNEQKKLENDPETKVTEQAEESVSAAPTEKTSARKTAEKKA